MLARSERLPASVRLPSVAGSPTASVGRARATVRARPSGAGSDGSTIVAAARMPSPSRLVSPNAVQGGAARSSRSRPACTSGTQRRSWKALASRLTWVRVTERRPAVRRTTAAWVAGSSSTWVAVGAAAASRSAQRAAVPEPDGLLRPLISRPRKVFAASSCEVAMRLRGRRRP